MIPVLKRKESLEAYTPKLTTPWIRLCDNTIVAKHVLGVNAYACKAFPDLSILCLLAVWIDWVKLGPIGSLSM